jgi:hypothetical protein
MIKTYCDDGNNTEHEMSLSPLYKSFEPTKVMLPRMNQDSSRRRVRRRKIVYFSYIVRDCWAPYLYAKWIVGGSGRTGSRRCGIGQMWNRSETTAVETESVATKPVETETILLYPPLKYSTIQQYSCQVLAPRRSLYGNMCRVQLFIVSPHLRSLLPHNLELGVGTILVNKQSP